MAEFSWEVDNSKLILKDGDATIASITGLKSDFVSGTWKPTTNDLKEYLEFTPHTMTTGDTPALSAAGIIKLKEAALTKGSSDAYTIQLTPNTEGTDYSNYYKLELDGATKDTGATTYSLGGAATAAKWTITNPSESGAKTASYIGAGTAEKWTLTNDTTITYAAEVTGNTLATITGLKSGLTVEQLNGNSSPITITDATAASGGKDVITLSKNALNSSSYNAGATIELTVNHENKYKLALGTGITKFDSEASTPKIASVGADGTTKKATITRTQSEGWKENTDGSLFTYTAATEKPLATVSNLSADITEEQVNETGTGKFGTNTGENDAFVEALTVNGNVVTLNRNALKAAATPADTQAVDIKDDDDIGEDTYKGFTLALNTSDSTYNATNKSLGFENVVKKWELAGTTATYKSNGNAEGWTLTTTGNNANKEVTYKAATTITTLATITNLNANVDVKDGKIGTYATAHDTTTAFTEGITVNETANEITLAKAVLTTTEKTEATGTEGQDGYVAATTQEQNATTLMNGKVPGANGVGEGAVTTYKLQLKANDGIVAPETVPSAASFKLVADADFDNNHNIKIQGTKAAGWNLVGDTKVTYTDAVIEDLATITNLNAAVVNNEGKFGTDTGENDAFVEGIHLDATAKTVTIDAPALTETAATEAKEAQGTEGEAGYQPAVAEKSAEDNATTLTLTTEGQGYKTSDNLDFNLKLGADTKAPGTEPIDIHLGNLADIEEGDEGSKQTVAKSLQVVGTMTEGWTLNSTAADATKNKKIIYTEETTPVLAEITNLNKSVVEKEVTTGTGANSVTVKKYGTGTGDDFVEGITLNGTTVTLKEAVLNDKEDTADNPSTAEVNEAKNNSTTLTIPASNTFDNYKDYKFALDGVTAPATTLSNIRLGELKDVKEDGGEAAVAKSVDVVGTLEAGWTLDTASGATYQKKVTYTDTKNLSLVTISGLDKEIAEGTDSNAGKFGKTVDTTWKDALTLDKDSKVVTLYSVGLQEGVADANKADNVTLTPITDSAVTNFDKGYKLALDDGVVQDGQDIVDGSAVIADVKDGTATIKARIAKHWDLDASGTKILYTADAAEGTLTEVATVKGLNAAIAKGTGENASKWGITDGENFKEAKISISRDATTGENQFKLGENAFTNSDITITPKQADTKEKFTLTLDNTFDRYNIGRSFGLANSTETVGFEPIYRWDKTNKTTTAYLKADRAEGWTLDTTDGSATKGKKVTYTGKTDVGQIVATITNLQKDIVAEDLTAEEIAAEAKAYGGITNKIAGITLTDTNTSDKFLYDTITLDKSVLTTTTGAPTTYTAGKELGGTARSYTFTTNNTEGADGLVPTASTAGENTKAFTSLGSTTTYNTITKEAYWTQSGNTITYTAQDTGAKLFTIKGLNSSITASDITVTEGESGNPGTIELKAGALDGKNVTLTNAQGKNYKLTLFQSALAKDKADNVPASTLTDAKWSLNSTGTTAYYKAKVAAGYELSNDGQTVYYTSAADDKTIVTLSGIKSGLSVSDDGAHIGVKDENDVVASDITLTAPASGETKTTITLTKDALGTSNVSLTGTGIGANYVLDLNADVKSTTAKVGTGTAEAPEVAAKFDGGTAPNAVDVWRVSGTTNTTATYKQVVPLYYTLNSTARNITHHAEKTEKTYATVTGLAKGLVVGEDTSATPKTWVGVKAEDGNISKDIKINDTTPTQIDLTAAALAATNVTVTKGANATADYTLSLGDAAADLAPARTGTTASDFTFAVSKDSSTNTTTAALRGTMKEGYTVADDKKSITYSTKNTNYTFATITGFKAGLTSSDFNSSTGAGVGFNPINNTITLKDAKMVGTTDIKLDATAAANDYKLAMSEASTSKINQDGTTTKNIWAVNTSTPTTYNYNQVIPANYTLQSQTVKVGNTDTAKESTMIKYTAEKTNSTITSISNLNSGLKITDGALEGVTLGTVDVSSGTFTESTSGTVFKLSSAALNTANSNPVTVTGSTYKLTLDADAKATDKSTEPYWTFSNGTATRKYDTTAGFVITDESSGTGTTVKYQAAKTDSTATTTMTITGLKSNLTVKSDGSIEGITIDDANHIVTLADSVLADNTVELTVPSGSQEAYTLDLQNASALAPKSGQLGFKVNKDGSVALMTGYTTAGYTAEGTTKFKYSEGKDGNTVATIKGLKSGLTVADGKIAGIETGSVDGNGKFTADNESGDVIRLNGDVLNKENVSITQTGSTYSLAIKTEKDEPNDTSTLVDTPDYSTAWKVPSKGNVTFTETTAAGYALDTTSGSETEGQIVYSTKKTVTTKLAGLNNNVKLIEVDATDEDGNVIKNADGTNQKVKVAGIDADHLITFKGSDVPEGVTGDAAKKNYGTFTLMKEHLKTANATLTNDKNYGEYTLALKSGDGAQAVSTGWIKAKNSDKATYTLTTAAGYTLADDGLKINYSATNTQKHYATLTGLNKDVEAEGGAITGIDIADTPSKMKDGETDTVVISLGYNVLTSTDVKVTGKNQNGVEYTLGLATEGENPNADDQGNTGKKWYEAQLAAPTWSNKNGTASLIGGTTESWEAQKQTAGADTTKPDDDVYDEKTIYYTAAKPETIATVSGVKVNTDGTVTGLALENWARSTTDGTASTGTIHLTADSLNKKDVTVEIPTALKEKYSFTFGLEGDIAEPEKGDNLWTTDGKGNATYQYTTEEGYTLDAAQTKLTYSKKKTTELATISGLVTTGTHAVKKDTTGKEVIDGIDVTTHPTTDDSSGETKVTEKGTITLTDKNILGNTVKITGGKYTLKLDDNVSTQEGGDKWYLKGTTATYSKYRTAGYDLDTEGTTAKKKAETATETLFTISGLKKNLKLTAITESGGIVVNEDKTVTITDDVLGTTKVTLKNGTYKDANDNNKEESYTYSFATENDFTTPEPQTPKWQFSKGTATLRQATTKGFELGSSSETEELNDVLNYKAAQTVSLAKVKNLNTKLKAFNEQKLTEDGETVTKNVIGTTKTEKGNGKNTTVIDKAVVTFDEENKSIKVEEDALNKKTVTFAGNAGNYTLELGEMTNTNTYGDQVTKWTVSGTNGTFKQYTPLYYSVKDDGTEITYTPENSPKTSIFAKVTNLKKDTTLTTQVSEEPIEKPNFTVTSKDAGDVGGVLTLYADNLNKKSVALSGNTGYALALGSDITGSLKSAVSLSSSSATANSKGTAVLKGTRSSGYEMAFGRKAITWISKDKTNQTVVTVTGLKKDATISADGNGVITLDSSKVNKKTLTLTSNLGTTDYIFDATALDTPEVTLRTKDDGTDNYWNLKGSTASIMGAVTDDGYITAASGKAVTYIKETAKYSKPNKETGVISHKNVAIATIKGMKSTDASTVDGSAKTITLSGYDLNEKVTVSASTFSVTIDDKFNNSSLTGSSAADNISVAGSGLTITGGKGDDHITDLGGSNTFVYANGAGNDVITGFTPGDDKLKVTKGTITVEHDNSDVIVKVGAGKIRLKGAYSKTSGLEGMNLTILNNKNVETTYFVPDTPTMTYASSSNTLLEDSNYSADAANLSSLVEPHAATYTPYDFDANSFSLTKEDKLTSAAVTYSGDTNKK